MLKLFRKGYEVSEKLRGGVECDGFAILANNGTGGSTVLHGISTVDLAAIIAGSDEVLGSSFIAKGIRDSVALKKNKADSFLAGLLGSLAKD